MTKAKLALALVGMLGTALMAAPPAIAQDASQPLYSTGGAQKCLTCHNEPNIVPILQTPHAVKGDARTPMGQHDCESCHGPSEAHANGRGRNRPLPNVVFVGPNASPVAKRNETCLTCHQSGLRMNWQGSQHASNDLACTTCHNPHLAKDAVLVKTSQPQVCFTCHQEQRAQSFEFSHHPIREGKVVCSDCHNPHGSPGPKLLKEFTVNETCYTCHMEKRGPYLWDHEPVRDSCLNCHTPHGSTQPRLLVERMPYLCQNCHETGNHNAAPWSANQVPGVNSVYNNSARTAPSGSHFQMIARSCANCHSQVHGSNSPAGIFLTR